MLADAQKAERQILDGARASAQSRIDAARAQLAKDREQTSTKLQAATKDLAQSIASKVLLRDGEIMMLRVFENHYGSLRP